MRIILSKISVTINNLQISIQNLSVILLIQIYS